MSDDIGDTKFGVQVSVGMVGIVLTQIAGFVGSVVLARIIGPSGYGLFYISLSIANFFENPIKGWAGATRKRLAEVDFDEGEALGSSIMIIAVVSVVGLPIAIALLSVLAENDITPYAVPVLFIPTAIYYAFSRVLMSRQNFSMNEWSTLIRTILKIVLQIGFVVAGFGVWGMVGGMAASTFLTIPLIYYWLDIRPKIPSAESLRSVARYAKWSVPSRFLGTGLSRMDVLLLGWLSAASAAGKYQVALQLVMPAAIVSSAIGTGLLGRLTNLRSREEDWYQDYRNAISMESILAIPIFFGSLVLAEELIVTVFSDQYAGAGPFLVGLAIYQFLDTQTSPRESVLGAIDRPDIGFYTSLVALIMNVSLGVGFWFVYGPVGIVIATVLTQAFLYATRTVAVRWLTGVETVITRPLFEQVVAGALMAILVWGLSELTTMQGLYATVALIGTGGITYFAALVGISPYFRTTVHAVYGDIRAEYFPKV